MLMGKECKVYGYVYWIFSFSQGFHDISIKSTTVQISPVLPSSLLHLLICQLADTREQRDLFLSEYAYNTTMQTLPYSSGSYHFFESRRWLCRLRLEGLRLVPDAVALRLMVVGALI